MRGILCAQSAFPALRVVRLSFLFLVALFVAAVVPANGAEQAGDTQRTVLDGVYASTQAERGREAYEAHCSSCHRPDLGGGPEPSALRGPVFLNRWREDTLDALYFYSRNRMPAEARGTLDDAVHLDMLAYILRRNGFPVGATELTAASAKDILLVGLSGPQPLPTNSIVQVVGCLTPDAEDWTLTRATAPRRTRREGAEPDSEGARPEIPLGEGTFQLLNPQHVFPRFDPEAHKDQKIRIEGVLFAGERISLTGVEVIDASCG